MLVQRVLVVLEPFLVTAPEERPVAERQCSGLGVAMVIEQNVVHERHRLHEALYMMLSRSTGFHCSVSWSERCALKIAPPRLTLRQYIHTAGCNIFSISRRKVAGLG